MGESIIMRNYLIRIIAIFVVIFSFQHNILAQEDTTLANNILSNPNLPELISVFQNINPDQQIEKAAFSNNERYIAIIKEDDTTAIIIDITDGLIVQVEHGSDILDILFSEDSKLLLTIGTDGITKSWNLEDFQLQARRISEENSTQIGAIWEETLVFIAEGHNVILWDAFSGESITTVELDIEPTYMYLSQENSYLSILDKTNTITIFDANNLNTPPIYVTQSECEGNLDIFSFNNDATYIYEGCNNGDIVIKSIISEEFIVLSNLNYIPFVLGGYSNSIFPILNESGRYFVNIVTIEQIEELSILDDRDLTHDSYQSASLDDSIVILGIEPLDNWEDTSIGAPAFNVVNTNTGEIIYFFGQTSHVQLSPNNTYILTVSIEGDVLIFRIN